MAELHEDDDDDIATSEVMVSLWNKGVVDVHIRDEDSYLSMTKANYATYLECMDKLTLTEIIFVEHLLKLASKGRQ